MLNHATNHIQTRWRAFSKIAKVNENLSGIEIKKSFQILPIWKGINISDTYGKKPVLNYSGNPVFAELYALREYSANGFSGVWADTFRNKFRTELPEKNEPKITLPEFVSETLNKINPNGKLSGTWDLVLWKESQIKFVELKRKGKDSIRKTQIEFLKRAIKVGISSENFEIYEWTEE